MSGLTTKGQATRDRIVAAAAELIHRQGVARTTTAGVEAAAGVSSSQIFHYFADKPSLVRAVIAWQSERIVAAQVALLAGVGGEGGEAGGGGAGLTALRGWRDAVVAMQSAAQSAGGCPLGSLAGELAEVDPGARVDLADGFCRWEDAIGGVLRAMARDGELRPGADVEQLALALLTALQGGLLIGQARRDTTALEAGLDAVLDRIGQLTVAPGHRAGVSGQA